MIDPTKQPLAYTIATDGVTVERDHEYAADGGPLAFDLYRPPRAPHAGPVPAIVFANGYPDPGMIQFVGAPLRQWASYAGWARMGAASGIAGVLSANRTPVDALSLVAELRRNHAALNIDPERIGVWACSGHGPTGLALFAKERLACAALLYPYTLDLDGHAEVATAAGQFRFSRLPLALHELPEHPLLVVRAGKDATPGLAPSLDRFIEAARARHLPIEVLDHESGVHSFDMLDPSPRTGEVIDATLAFLRRALRAAPG